MIFSESSQKEFDFDSLIGNKEYATIAGLSVEIDRIIRDVTQTTVIAISGTMILQGVKLRGVWDMYGNIIEFKQIFKLFLPRGYSMDDLFSNTNAKIFKLVHVQKIDK